MTQKKRFIVVKVAFLMTIALGVQAECTRMVITADPGYPPLHWYDGKTLQGASISIAKRVLDDLSIPYEVRYVGPFPRVMAAAKNGSVDMVSTLKKTPERDAFLLYPTTWAFSNPVAVFTTREKALNFNSRSDLIGLKGGITRGNKFGADLDDFLKNKLSIEEVNTPENSFGMLRIGRIDYFITGYYAGMAYLLRRGDEDRFSVKEPFLVDTPNYLTITRNGHCADKIAAIDARLAVLKSSGVLDELVRQSIANWKANPVMVGN